MYATCLTFVLLTLSSRSGKNLNPVSCDPLRPKVLRFSQWYSFFIDELSALWYKLIPGYNFYFTPKRGCYNFFFSGAPTGTETARIFSRKNVLYHLPLPVALCRKPLSPQAASGCLSSFMEVKPILPKNINLTGSFQSPPNFAPFWLLWLYFFRG
jgi:hypothetical protein